MKRTKNAAAYKRVIKALKTGMNAKKACDQQGVTHAGFYQWKAKHSPGRAKPAAAKLEAKASKGKYVVLIMNRAQVLDLFAR